MTEDAVFEVRDLGRCGSGATLDSPAVRVRTRCEDLCHSSAVGPAGEIVLGGTYGGTLDFGFGPMTSVGTGYDAFLAKLPP